MCIRDSLDKKLSAGMQKSLAQGRKGAKFSIVDPAYTPVVPVVPNIPLIMAAGLVLGCALGFGGAVGLELMGRGFRSAEEVELTLGLPVIASIPLYESAFGGSMQTCLLYTSSGTNCGSADRRDFCSTEVLHGKPDSLDLGSRGK